MKARSASLPLFFAVALALSLSACTSPQVDRSTNYTPAIFRTRLDFQPPNSEERDRQLGLEERDYERATAPLKDKFEGLKLERELLYTELEGAFPECKRQRHCLQFLAKGTVERFERYRPKRQQITALDREIYIVESQIAQWDRRRDLRRRALFNRYVVYELLQTREWGPDIQDVTVHSLEAYPDRRALSHRLVELTQDGLEARVLGDLQFRMLGRPVDEASVLATLDLRFKPEKIPRLGASRALITLLVNSHQVDPHQYERGFLREWTRRVGEPNRQPLLSEVFCGLYGIAGETLVARLNSSKAKPCAPLRLKLQAERAEAFSDRFDPAKWLLPIAFVQTETKEGR